MRETSKKLNEINMKTLIKILLISFLLQSCDIQKESFKQKNDFETNERIETKEVRKGDTVTYIVPNVIYKDTVITTTSRQGTILKTYYDKQGNISKSDCISSEIDLLRLELRNLKDNSITKEKIKEESFFDNPLIWLIIALLIVFILKK
jgi:hypothetical protein